MNDPKPTTPILGEEGRRIAVNSCPDLWQGCKTGFDPIQSITNSEEVRFLPNPELYYSVRGSSDGIVYTTFGIYHRYDPAARHHHDFEGIIIEGSGNYLFCGPVNVMRIAHLGFKFIGKSAHGDSFIESGGHGIHPISRINNDAPIIIYHPHHFQLKDMNEWDEDFWKNLEEMFGEIVKTPRRWVDPTMNEWAHKHHPTISGETYFSTRGLCWDKPEILFEFARRMGRL